MVDVVDTRNMRLLKKFQPDDWILGIWVMTAPCSCGAGAGSFRITIVTYREADEVGPWVTSLVTVHVRDNPDDPEIEDTTLRTTSNQRKATPSAMLNRSRGMAESMRGSIGAPNVVEVLIEASANKMAEKLASRPDARVVNIPSRPIAKA